MALVLKDRVQESATPNTTVSFTCNGAITGFQAFSVVGNGNVTFYTAVDASGNWENGVGTYTTAGNLVTRTTISASSNAGSAVTFSGTVNLFISYPATNSINYDANGVATIGEVLGYSDTGLVGSFASTVAGYNQVVVQNKSTATNASSNLNVSNDAGTASANYAELGINSSTFSNGAGCFNIPGAAYVASAGEDLSIGTYNSHNIHFATNSNTTDSMTIYTTGGISLGTYGDPGLGNVAGNKFVAGYSSITSAAGITILTAASTYYQRVVGTAIQTIQLPDATTCLVGTTFIIENNSTGLLTITDDALGAIDIIPAGGVDYIYLIANGTIAGTWARYALLPSTYNFNSTAADFGAATLSNAVWNGTPIAYNYGGTTLTTFVGANKALYSTSATALTAGTLPVLAGGTGVTTSTGTGSTVLSASPTFTGTVNTANLAYTGTLTGGTGVVIIGTNQIYKDASGNVGIGTSSPSTFGGKLSVVGAGGTQSTVMVQNPGVGTAHLGFASSGSNVKLYNCYATGTLAGGSGIDISSTGAVGIGMSPSYKLDMTVPSGDGIRVNASAGISYVILQQGGVTNGHISAAGGGGTDLSVTATRFLNLVGGSSGTILFTAGTEAMRIDAAGNVGIGTSSPLTKTEITGTGLTLATGTSNGLLFNRAGTASQVLFKDTSTDVVTLQNANAAVLSFGTNATQRMSISGTGSLILVGSIAQKATGTTWSNPSDIRLKDSISPYTKGLNELMQVAVKEWEYNGKGGTTEGLKGLGVIADEVMLILPNTVDTYKAKLNADDDEDSDIKKFDATEITWLMLKSIQELKAIIDTQNARIEALEAN